MEQILYGKGWTIRGPKNASGRYPFLSVKGNGGVQLADPVMKNSGFPWTRFTSKEDAENFLKTHPIDGAEAVQPIKSKYFQLVDAANGLYKVVPENGSEIRAFGLDNVKYIDDKGNINDLPPVPDKVDPLNYLFNDYIRRWAVGAATIQQTELKLPYDTRLKVTYFLNAFDRRRMKVTAQFFICTNDNDLKHLIDDNSFINAADVVRKCKHFIYNWRWGFQYNSLTQEQCIAGSWEICPELPQIRLYEALLEVPGFEQYPQDIDALSKEQLAQLKKALLNKQIENEVEANLIKYLQKRYAEPSTNQFKQFAEEFIQRGKEIEATEEFDENLSLHELFGKLYSENY